MPLETAHWIYELIDSGDVAWVGTPFRQDCVYYCWATSPW